MNKKLLLLLVFIFCTIISLSAVSAGDINDNISSDDTDINSIESDCCSFVIQGENNDTIFSFRQDSPVYNNSRGIRIETETWQGHELIKQRIDSNEDYFFHAIITDNGWVIGHGGSAYNNASRIVENVSLSMVADNQIDMSYLQQIKEVFAKWNYGHLLIKAPDGRFGLVVQDMMMVGVLKPGSYLVGPNEVEYLKGGDYKKYSDDPVQAIIEICSWDDSGFNRRDQMIYHYKPQITSDGVYYGVDVYVSNDNGIHTPEHFENESWNSSKIVVPFYYEGVYYPTSVIPEYPEKLYVDTHIFKNQPIDDVFELVETVNNAVAGEEVVIHYKLNNIIDNCTAVFQLDNKTKFKAAKVSTGSYYYDADSNKVYWNIPANRQDKEIEITVIPETVGTHEIVVYLEDTNVNTTLNFNVSENNHNSQLSTSSATGNPILILLCALGLLFGGLRFKK